MAVLTTQTPTLHSELVSLLSSLIHFTPTLTKLAQEQRLCDYSLGNHGSTLFHELPTMFPLHYHLQYLYISDWSSQPIFPISASSYVQQLRHSTSNFLSPELACSFLWLTRLLLCSNHLDGKVVVELLKLNTYKAVEVTVNHVFQYTLI